MREIIKLVCTGVDKVACSLKNVYSTTKNKKASTKKLEKKKYCKSCKKHTVHKEGR